MSAFEQDEVQRRVRRALFGAGELVTIGRFALLRRIGKGSMGLVYAARDTELDRLVAVKVLELEHIAPEHRRELARRMQREAQALARIRHPHVVAVYEAGAEGDIAFIVMEHVEGEGLDRWLDTGERSIDEVLDVLVDAGRGLSAAHIERLVHRDFKRENVLVDREGRAKVADLGLVRALEPEEQTGALRTALTTPGAVVGTIATMAPEQLRGERPDAASDQFSFAVTAWEALYGESPFPSGALADRLRDLTHAKLRDPPADTLVPPAVQRVLLRALAAEPARRFPSMDALVAALERARAGPERDALLGGRYRLLGILGEGGMGAVHRARDERDGREVAIKLIVADPRARQRVAEEARAASRLAHPGIVRVLDVDEEAGYLVMELVEGLSLRELLLRGPFELREALALTAELARTLAAAHDAGLVHRDVKPDNVIRRSDGRTVLLDLGLAAAAHEAASGGTPGYMAPEQVRGEAAGAAADQFALAVTAYELIAGRSPWRGGHAAALAQTLEVDPPPCSDDPAISAVIARGMAKEAGARYPDLRAFAGAIEQAARRPSSHRWRWLTLALVTAALVIGAALRADPAPSIPPASPLSAPDSVLACPVLEARGVEAPAGWLGAAAADLACRRAQWLLGGRLERVRMPGHLLELPRRPSASLPADPYASPDARERSREAARRHEAWLDGSVERAPEGSFSVRLALHAPEGLVSRADGAAATLSGAVERAMEQLGPAIPRADRLDPEVARFFGSDDVELALRVNRMRFDGSMLDAGGVCRELVGRTQVVAPNATLACYGAHPSLGAPAVRLDRSSAAALARTAPAYLLAHPEADAHALAEELRAAREREPSLQGRVRLALAEGHAFGAAGDSVRAQRALLIAARLSPHEPSIWHALTVSSQGESGDSSARRAYAAWAPSDAASWDGLAFTEDRARLGETRYQRRAYELLPSVPLIAIDLARRYIRSGRREDARAVAAELAARGSSHALATDLVSSFADAADARFERALERLLARLSTWPVFGDGSSGDITALDFALHLADLLGREREVGGAMAQRFVLGARHRLHPSFRGGDATMINACRRAEPAIAERCLERMAELPLAGIGPASSEDARLREGALRYVRGDVEGAVDAWRPLVPLDVYRLEVPAEAFDQAGETELAREIDAARLSAPAVFGGAHLAHAREARRAETRGELERARELARQVLAAWSTADAPVPVLDEMRELAARP